MNIPPHGNHEMPNDSEDEIPPFVNGNQPPNLNTTVSGHGSGCEHGHNIGEGDGGDSDSEGDRNVIARIGYERGEANDGRRDIPVDGTESIDGDEGAEDHLIEVGDLGMVPIRSVLRSLARHRRCICDSGALPPPNDDCPWTTLATPAGSEAGTPFSSLIVEVGSSLPSMSSSGSLGYRSTSSPTHSNPFNFMNGGVNGETLAFESPSGFLWLVPAVEISHQPYRLELHESDFGDFED